MDIKDFNSEELIVFSIDSLSELSELLIRNGSKEIFGSEEEGLNGFFYLNFLQLNKSIGLCSSTNGKSSGCRKFKDKVLIYNDHALFIMHTSFKIDWSIVADGLIYEVAINDNKVIVIHEIGVDCFTEVGQKNWSLSTDIITNFSIFEDKISISFDQETKNISLVTGKIL